MKRIFTLLLFLVSTAAFSQSSYQDVVYLKNGTIIRGIIIERVPNKSIKIETVTRNVFVFQMNEIEKLTKEPIKRKSFNQNPGPGYRGNVELGYQIGVGDFGMDRLALNFINGYQFNPYLSVGIGTGLRYYFDAQAALVPLFVNAKANFTSNRTSPYFSLAFGYSFDATNDFYGTGLLLNPTAGVSFEITEKSKMNVGIGYEMQRMEFFYWNLNSNYFDYTTKIKNSGAICINVGISF